MKNLIALSALFVALAAHANPWSSYGFLKRSELTTSPSGQMVTVCHYEFRHQFDLNRTIVIPVVVVANGASCPTQVERPTSLQ